MEGRDRERRDRERRDRERRDRERGIGRGEKGRENSMYARWE
jgi:hypothetical protein